MRECKHRSGFVLRWIVLLYSRAPGDLVDASQHRESQHGYMGHLAVNNGILWVRLD